MKKEGGGNGGRAGPERRMSGAGTEAERGGMEAERGGTEGHFEEPSGRRPYPPRARSQRDRLLSSPLSLSPSSASPPPALSSPLLCSAQLRLPLSFLPTPPGNNMPLHLAAHKCLDTERVALQSKHGETQLLPPLLLWRRHPSRRASPCAVAPPLACSGAALGAALVCGASKFIF